MASFNVARPPRRGQAGRGPTGGGFPSRDFFRPGAVFPCSRLRSFAAASSMGARSSARMRGSGAYGVLLTPKFMFVFKLYVWKVLQCKSLKSKRAGSSDGAPNRFMRFGAQSGIRAIRWFRSLEPSRPHGEERCSIAGAACVNLAAMQRVPNTHVGFTRRALKDGPIFG